jgi:dihydroxyacetone kinase-like protein
MYLDSKEYVEYLSRVATVIKNHKDYITRLDAETGDGDHWVNLNMGFDKLLEQKKALKEMSLAPMFKKIAIILMSTIGGSSGILYGSAYLKASKVVGDKSKINVFLLKDILEAELEGIMERGKAKPGYKTMIDTLYRALEYMTEAMNNNVSDKEILLAMKKGAAYGMNETAQMEAIKGRACYQTDKGVGKLDPGAVTMNYQLETLVDYILEQR